MKISLFFLTLFSYAISYGKCELKDNEISLYGDCFLANPKDKETIIFKSIADFYCLTKNNKINIKKNKYNDEIIDKVKKEYIIDDIYKLEKCL